MASKFEQTLAVVGVGNVGASLLFELAAIPESWRVLVASRTSAKCRAAIHDVASAAPSGAAKMSVFEPHEASEVDVLVLTCGVRMRKGVTRRENLRENRRITVAALESVRLSANAVVIVVASPVDTLTREVHEKLANLPPSRIIGFGGDLDRNRLHYILQGQRAGAIAPHAFIVGEHGERAIPVFDDETQYDAVATEVRQFVAAMAQSGPLRNQSAGVMLGRLCKTIMEDDLQTHTVCGMHSGHGLFLTWPFQIGRQGVQAPVDVSLGVRSQRELEGLIDSYSHPRKS